MHLFKDAVRESSQSSRSIVEGTARRRQREEIFVCEAMLAAAPPPPPTTVPRHTLNTDKRGGFDPSPSPSPFVSPFLPITRQLALFSAAPTGPRCCPRRTTLRPSVPLLLNLCVCTYCTLGARLLDRGANRYSIKEERPKMEGKEKRRGSPDETEWKSEVKRARKRSHDGSTRRALTPSRSRSHSEAPSLDKSR